MRSLISIISSFCRRERGLLIHWASMFNSSRGSMLVWTFSHVISVLIISYWGGCGKEIDSCQLSDMYDYWCRVFCQIGVCFVLAFVLILYWEDLLVLSDLVKKYTIIQSSRLLMKVFLLSKWKISFGFYPETRNFIFSSLQWENYLWSRTGSLTLQRLLLFAE